MIEPITLKRELRQYWKYWNLGRYSYFRKPRDINTARFRSWRHTKHEANMDRLRSMLSASNPGRWVPAGDYVKLQIKGDSEDIFEEPGWTTFMSDTPDEMNDHLAPILNAQGRVLIHGLGLGCVLHCLLHKPGVTHIDIVEVNEDVLNLVMPFYLNRGGNVSLHFHLGSCVDIKWPKGTRWNYIWHDIWSKIAAENLKDDTEPEHGISYERLHRMFGNRCDRQDSWAFNIAKQVRRVDQVADRLIRSWQFTWNRTYYERRLEMLAEATCGPLTPPDLWKKFLFDSETQEHMGTAEMAERYRSIARREMSLNEARMILHDLAYRYAQQKVGLRK